jgi:RNA polymerase sigma-70 factor (ECF subfamily)
MPNLSTTELHLLHKDADRVARRVTTTSRLPYQDREDIRQELLLDLLVRLPCYRSERSQLRSFANLCFRHRAVRLSSRSCRDLRARHPISLETPLPGENRRALVDTLAESDGYAAWMGQPTDRFAALELRLDLQRVLARLPAASRSHYFALQRQGEQGKHAVVGARTTVFRRTLDLRRHLREAGISMLSLA